MDDESNMEMESRVAYYVTHLLVSQTYYVEIIKKAAMCMQDE